MTEERTPVLIVGAGAAGLSLSLLLLQQGVTPMLVERRPEISWYPRARNLNFRTLEVFRGLGLSDRIRAVGSDYSRVIRKDRLASPDQEVIDSVEQALEGLHESVSPEPLARYCPQGKFEPVLLAAARERGADVRYGAELTSVVQDDNGVAGTLVDHATGATRSVRADYLVAADGAHSRIRDHLGIPVSGVGELDEHYLFIYFRAPWTDLVRGHEADAFLVGVGNPAGLIFVGDHERGAFALMSRPGSGAPSVEAITREQAAAMVRDGIGRPDMPVEILELAPWRPTQRVADVFQRGRVLLAGDAAHTMPPKLGLGANSAIQSAQNLAWKLAAVLRGHASEDLLATYQVERHGLAWLASHRSLTGPAAALLEGDEAAEARAQHELPLASLIIGYRYRSRAVVDDASGPAPESGVELLARPEPRGEPGARVPHVWLEQRGSRVSTIDLVEDGFVLLTGPDGAPWCDAARAASSMMGVGVAAHRIGTDGDLLDPDGTALASFGISSGGAILVRPDGFVGWRTDALVGSPERTLDEALHGILGRRP